MKLQPILLAAGFGTRMRSRIPKMLHPLGGKPLVLHALDAAAALGGELPIVVVGHGEDVVRQAVGPRACFAVQEQMLGTGHARDGGGDGCPGGRGGAGAGLLRGYAAGADGDAAPAGRDAAGQPRPAEHGHGGLGRPARLWAGAAQRRWVGGGDRRGGGGDGGTAGGARAECVPVLLPRRLAVERAQAHPGFAQGRVLPDRRGRDRGARRAARGGLHRRRRRRDGRDQHPRPPGGGRSDPAQADEPAADGGGGDADRPRQHLHRAGG